MRIAVIGADGQLGSDVVATAAGAGHDVQALTHSDVEITDAASVRRALSDRQPDAVVNAAAMNHVERCERELSLAFAVNAVGPRNIASAAAELGVPLLHVSTDYVFGGEKTTPYVENDLPGPMNVYGTSKLAGEYFVRALDERHFVVRTSALYGIQSCRSKPQDNFVRAMLRLGRERGRVRVVSDERVSPTWTGDLAAQLVWLLEHGRYGVYHATSQGDCSWIEFARAIFQETAMPVELEAVTAAEYGASVRRPANSVLENTELQRIGADLMPHWRDSLRRFLALIGKGSTQAASDQVLRGAQHR